MCQFEAEAEILLSATRKFNSITTIAGLLLLFVSFSARGQGTNELPYLKDATEMALDMKLLREPDALGLSELTPLSDEQQAATAHTTWGLYNMIM